MMVLTPIRRDNTACQGVFALCPECNTQFVRTEVRLLLLDFGGLCFRLAGSVIMLGSWKLNTDRSG